MARLSFCSHRALDTTSAAVQGCWQYEIWRFHQVNLVYVLVSLDHVHHIHVRKQLQTLTGILYAGVVGMYLSAEARGFQCYEDSLSRT